MPVLNPFPEWLLQQLNVRGWIPADLVRATGRNSSTISRWMNPRGGPPSPSSCISIAAALKIDENEVLKAAGHLSAMGEESAVYVAREIDPRLIAIARVLANDADRFEQWLEIGEVFLRHAQQSR